MNLKKIGTVISLMLLASAIGMKIIGGFDMITWISVDIMIIFLIILLCEVIPITLACILTLGLMPVLGMTNDFNTALSGFSNQVVFFILASFGIAAALMKVPISKRILRFLLLKFGKNSKLLVFVFMICTALVSSVISNVPTCAVFIAITSEFMKLLSEEERKQTGKTFMIGIPVASMIGGIMTPAGSSINLLAISLLENSTDSGITFVQWMSFGIPIVIIFLPLAWFVLVKVFPPAEIEKSKINNFVNKMQISSNFNNDEKRALLIFSVIFILWLSSSWIRSINIMVVSLLGCGVLCLPKIGVLSSKEFMENVSWDAVFLVGTVLSLGSALVRNGVSDKMIDLIPEMGENHILILAGIALATFLLLVFIPVAPSLITIFTPIVIHIAISSNIDPGLAVMLCAMCAGNCYLFPLDTVCLLSYSQGYYKMFEMPKVTAKLQICFVLIASLCVYGIGKVVF